VSNDLEPPPTTRRIWPFFVLAGVVLGGVLAYVWVSAEVRRLKSIERFDYRPPAKEAQTSTPSPTNLQQTTSPSATPTAVSTNVLIAGFLDTLSGGDAGKGRNIFFNKPEANCGKCHRVGAQGGDNGPVLDGIGSRAMPEFILESMVAPNAVIAKGFETVAVRLKNGSGVSGVLRQETETNLVIHTGDDGVITVNKSDVTERFVGVSPMPANLGELISKAELRDLMAFLTSLTNSPAEK